MTPISVDDHFAGKPADMKATYDCLVAALRTFGLVKEASKQTSIHLEKNSGFAGVHPRKDYFSLEFRTDYPIDNPRIIRKPQLSARRYEHTVKLAKASDVDDQLLQWLKDAYDLSK
jgi:hypothetical protein